MKDLTLFISFLILFSFIEYFLIGLQIKHNIGLFYDIHRKEVIKILNKHKKETIDQFLFLFVLNAPLVQ